MPRARAPLTKPRSVLSAFTVVGLAFRLFGRRADAPTPTVSRRVVIEGHVPPALPAPKPPPAPDPLQQGLLFRGLHGEANPAESVRTGTMTCPACNHSFRFFRNSDGKATVVRCPSCAKTYRV